MKQLGYYAKDKNNNLFRFEWGEDNGSQTNEDFFIIRNGEKRKSIASDYEILEIGFFTADSPRELHEIKAELNFDRLLYNIILVHVSRTWERLRVVQEHDEMPIDNIGSAADTMPMIADTIYEGKIMQGFINGNDEVRDDYWINNTKEGMSDSYIEAEATKIINRDYLGINTFDAVPYKPIYEEGSINPRDIIGVSPIEFVVEGKNFDGIYEAFVYWGKLKLDSNIEDLEPAVIKRVWVSLSDEAMERDDRGEGSVECNMVAVDFLNNSYERGSIGYELWEWLKLVTSESIGKYTFEILWDDVTTISHALIFKKYDVDLDTVINDIVDIDHMDIGGSRGCIEFDEEGTELAKQNINTVLRLMQRYRNATLN